MAEPSKPAPEAGAAAAAAPRRGKRLMVMAVVALLVLAAGAGAGWHFLLRGHPKAEAKEQPAKPPKAILKIGTVVVNISGTEGRRYLRATVELGALPADAKHLEELRAPLLDSAISVMGTKPLPELLAPGEREALRAELKERLNAASGGHGITHVFLTEFVIQ